MIIVSMCNVVARPSIKLRQLLGLAIKKITKLIDIVYTDNHELLLSVEYI